MISVEILRQARFGPFTYFDTLTAYVGVLLVSPLLTKLFSKIHIYISKIQWLFLVLPIAVIFHLILRLNTPYMRMLLDTNFSFSSISAKLVLLFMLFMGLRNVWKKENIK